MRVWLERATATRVRGGSFQVVRYPHPTPGREWRIGEIVKQILEDCVLPAARSAGVIHTMPAFGVGTYLSAGSERAFVEFADAADGEWPLTGRIQEMWDELVTVCLTEHEGFSRTKFISWLEESGWEQGLAMVIADRFYADWEGLARVLERVAR